MKYFLPILLIFSFVLCEEYEDVVYLKNGSVIRGMIIEQSPNKYIKIKSGKNIFVYQMDEIEKITKELNEEVDSKSNIIDKTFSINLGLDENLNFVSLRKDFKISKGIYFSSSVGGLYNYVNLGIKIEPNYNEKGFSMIANSGFFIDYYGDPIITFHVSPSYQLRLGKKSSAFINLGGFVGLWWDINWGDVYPAAFPIVNLNVNF